MRSYRLSAIALKRIAEIEDYTIGQWGEAQAERYVQGLFAAFSNVASGALRSRPIPAAYEVDGQFARYASHFIYWREMSDGDVGIATVLHVRMDLPARLQEDMPP